MSKKKQYESKKVFKVGLLFLISIAIAMFVIFSIAQKQYLFKAHYQLYTKFREVGGLKIGSPVRLAGVNVGTVTDIVFPENVTDKYVHITLNITRDVQDKIRTDSVATIETVGLLGDQYIDITFGSADAFILNPYDTLNSAEPYLLGDFLGKGQNVLDNLQEASEHLTSILAKIDEGRGLAGSMINEPAKYKSAINNISESAESLKEIIDSIKKGEGSIGSLFKKRKVYDDLESISDSLSQIMNKINAGEGTLGKIISDKDLYDTLVSDLKKASNAISNFAKDLEESKGPLASLLTDEEMNEKLKRSADNLERTTESLKNITQKIDSGQGTIGALINDKEVYNDLRDILKGAKKNWLVRFFTSLGKKEKESKKRQNKDKTDEG